MLSNYLLFIGLVFAIVPCFVQPQFVPVHLLLPANRTYDGPKTEYRPVSNYTKYNYSYGYNYNHFNKGNQNAESYLKHFHPAYPVNNNNHRTNNGTHNGHLFVGNIQLYDRLLFNQVYHKEKRWWGTREKIIEYPKDAPAGYYRHEVIYAIRIYNQRFTGYSTKASILNGGVGYQYVKIKLESGWNQGFQYLVQIYGH